MVEIWALIRAFELLIKVLALVWCDNALDRKSMNHTVKPKNCCIQWFKNIVFVYHYRSARLTVQRIRDLTCIKMSLSKPVIFSINNNPIHLVHFDFGIPTAIDPASIWLTITTKTVTTHETKQWFVKLYIHKNTHPFSQSMLGYGQRGKVLSHN